MNIGHLALENIDQFGVYDLLHFEGTEYSNVQLLGMAAGLADALRENGVCKGDFVMVCMPNSPWVIAAFQATWKIGAVAMPIMPQLLPHELSYMLADSGVKVVLTAPALAAKLQAAVAEAGTNTDVLVLGEGKDESDASRNITSKIVISQPQESLRRLGDTTADDLAVLLYTSGTTGYPKGVMLSHGNLEAVAQAQRAMNVDTQPHRVTLQVLPLSHSFGVSVMNAAFMLGVRMVLLPRFDPGEVLEAISKYKVQMTAVVPTMLTALLAHDSWQDTDLSSLEQVWTGGATLPNALRQRFQDAADCEVLDGYGQTECAPLATCYQRGETYRPGSVGRAVTGVTVSIRDDADTELPSGEWGEICIQGANVMKGYLNKPEATGEALRAGWLRSGDIGYMDEDGYVYITDRKKDLIIKGGENISPREIEEVLSSHPAVAEAAVIGLPDDRYGEIVCAVIVPRGSGQLDEGALLAFASNSITRFKLPTKIEIRSELPKSGVGKILKRELRAQLSETAP